MGRKQQPFLIKYQVNKQQWLMMLTVQWKFKMHFTVTLGAIFVTSKKKGK